MVKRGGRGEIGEKRGEKRGEKKGRERGAGKERKCF